MPDGDQSNLPQPPIKGAPANSTPGPTADVGPSDPISPRQRQIILHDQTNQWLAYGVTIGFFLLIVLLFFHQTGSGTSGSSDLLYTLLGVVGTGWASIISYYFGSSLGSNQKSQTIDAMLDKPPSP